MRIKKYMIILLAIALLFAVSANALGLEGQDEAVEYTEYRPQFTDAEKEKIDKDNAASFLYARIDGAGAWPAEYAGSYVSDGRLVVLLTDISPKITEPLIAYADDPSQLEFIKVKYSYQYLDALSMGLAKELKAFFQVSGYAVDVDNNLAQVEVVPEDYEKALEYATKHWEGKPYRLKAMPFAEVVADLRGGDKLHVSAGTGDSGQFTLGICGTYNGNKAVLSCGHLMTLNDSIYLNTRTSANKIGTVQVANFPLNGYGDYSIIYTSNHNYTNKVITGTSTVGSVTNTISRPANMDTLWTYGSKSKQLIQLRCSDSYRDLVVTVNNVSHTIKDQYYCSIKSTNAPDGIIPGDSGSPVWKQNSDGTFQFAGIMSARHGNTNCFVTPLASVTSNFTVKTN